MEVDRAVDAFKASKVQYIHLADAEVKRWPDIARPVVHDKWAGSVKSTGVDGHQLLSGFKALGAKHEASYSYVPGFDRLGASK